MVTKRSKLFVVIQGLLYIKINHTHGVRVCVKDNIYKHELYILAHGPEEVILNSTVLVYLLLIQKHLMTNNWIQDELRCATESLD